MPFDFPANYPALRFDRPGDGVLLITMDGPGLNAVSPDGHRELGRRPVVAERLTTARSNYPCAPATRHDAEE
jgi:hypothetical protein